MFGRKSAEKRPVVGLDMDLGDGWYDIEFGNPNWPAEVADAVAAAPDEREALRSHLADKQESFENVAATGAMVWVLIRPEAPGRSICTMSYGVSPVGEVTPDAYERSLAADEGRREPGVRYDAVRTWQVDIAAGIAVGAYNLLGHVSLTHDGVASEERTQYCVFPSRSSDAIEITFSTFELDQFDDFVAQTMEWVASLEVELER